MTMRPNQDEFRERITQTVLNALDDCVNNIIHEPFKGWQDEDLKHLLPVIRSHADKLYGKYFPNNNQLKLSC